jgi:hypothetical protein
VVTKLDRLARSLRDARAIADELTARRISLSLGGSVYDPIDAVGRLLFNVLAMVAEFESDLIRLRIREGMKVAKAKGPLRGKQPKLNRKQEAHLVSLVHSGEYSTLEVAELFGVGRSTVYRALSGQQIHGPNMWTIVWWVALASEKTGARERIGKRGGELNVLDGLPRVVTGGAADQFSPVVAVHSLGEGVTEAVPDGPIDGTAPISTSRSP